MDEPSCSNMEKNCDSNFEIIPSQRGGDLLILNGRRYTKRRKNKNGHIGTLALY